MINIPEAPTVVPLLPKFNIEFPSDGEFPPIVLPVSANVYGDGAENALMNIGVDDPDSVQDFIVLYELVPSIEVGFNAVLDVS